MAVRGPSTNYVVSVAPKTIYYLHRLYLIKKWRKGWGEEGVKNLRFLEDIVYGRPLTIIQNLNLPKSMRFPEEGCVQKVAKVRQLTKIKGRTTIFRSNQDKRLMLKSTLIAGQGSSKSKNFCLTQISALLLSFLREKIK